MRISTLALCLIVGATLLFVGCSTDAHFRHSGPLHVDVTAKVEAKLTLKGDIKGEAEVTRILGFIVLGPTEWAEGVAYGGASAPAGGLLSGVFGGGGDASLAKQAAAWNAVKSGNNMVIVAPRYDIHVDDFFVFKATKATVQGKGADIASLTAK